MVALPPLEAGRVAIGLKMPTVRVHRKARLFRFVVHKVRDSCVQRWVSSQSDVMVVGGGETEQRRVPLPSAHQVARGEGAILPTSLRPLLLHRLELRG